MPAFFSSKPILVTGSYRNGTTWMGRMLSASPYVNLVMEPFNPEYKTGLGQQGFDRFQTHFAYITKQNEADSYDIVKNLLIQNSQFHSSNRYLSRLSRILNLKARPLLKDPVAPMSAEWLSNRFDADVVVIVRHPAGAVDSFVNKMKWGFDLKVFLKQPDLMNDWLYPFEDKIANPPADPYEVGAILWSCVYHVLHGYAQRNPEWVVKRHEDVASDPLREFKEIYSRINLPYGKQVQHAIQKNTSSENPIEAPNHQPDYTKRDSKKIPKSWQSHLQQDTINKIRELTEEVASNYYSSEDWE